MEISDKFKEIMENESDNEEISDSFVCCICRDLLYKPVVLACGHISCFWCVTKSMSGLRQSCCPICRNKYYHFPSICQTLHLLLLKMYPIAYKSRENQTLEDEKATGFFSPQFDGLTYEFPSEEKIQTCIFEADRPSNLCSTGKEDTLVRSGQVFSDSNLQVYSDKSNLQMLTKDDETDSTTDDTHLHPKYQDGTCKPFSVNDVLCGSCISMLFQPIVLNCGHVFCATCFIIQTNETLKCQVCQSPHPGKIPKVCLEFDHFLEEQFPKEYALRRVAFQTRQAHFRCESPSSPEGSKEKLHISSSSGKDPLPLWKPGSNVHCGFGCDSCGMYPIIGDRYRCKECVEEVGYDLCEDCYTTRSKLPGRFNQKHTPEHGFEMIKSNPTGNIMLRLLRGQLEEVVAASNALSDAVEDLANAFSSLSHDGLNATNTSTETGLNASNTSTETEENQCDERGPT